jgi:superfamily II DNA or RNA helicase
MGFLRCGAGGWRPEDEVLTMRLEDITADAHVTGIDPAGPVEIRQARQVGPDVLEVTYKTASGQLSEELLYRSNEGQLALVEPGRTWSFTADGHEFRLAAEAQRITLAHLFDPMLAVSVSSIEPLPHQIEAVYGEMLPRTPLRFLLADDPGAGKTIMAGLYIKELMLRGDVERCLIVAPGGLVSQWREELYEKFGLNFEIITKEHLDSVEFGDVFQTKPLLLGRVDQLARREELAPRLREANWDLVVVDEAHRMSAHYSGEVKRTKKYQLGQLLGSTARHFLLMTATPHAGKESDFQLFLALLDSDRFEGQYRDGVHTTDASDLMRRMVKEDLLRFDGTPLFPERLATTVRYELSDDEMTLYDEATSYVSTEMDRASRLDAKSGRRTTVGFALTTLQRRLASSPEAIYQSLRRRKERLEKQLVQERQKTRLGALGQSPEERLLADLLDDEVDSPAPGVLDPDLLEDLDPDDREAIESGVTDAATAALTVAELEQEIAVLGDLKRMAEKLRSSGNDRKWIELANLLDEEEMTDSDGTRHKLIVFTEHRDTMRYLEERLGEKVGRNAVVSIHGGTTRDERRSLQAQFTQDPSVSVLVATDAASEGINLQRAHLLINYDLPWNPNRIEQRFGRVHRIGQREVCHMWNLVAEDTREDLVYGALLNKIEAQRQAYKGRVYDVLGDAISGHELSGLFVKAIRYGNRPDVRAEIDRVIDDQVGERVRKAIKEPALAASLMTEEQHDRIRHRMEEAEAQRLQPHYVRSFFLAAFEQLGGRLREREPGRYEVVNVPHRLRSYNRLNGRGEPILSKYERVTFDRDALHRDGKPDAQLVTPGHPLLDATIGVLQADLGSTLREGAVLVDDNDPAGEPRVLIFVEHDVVDARPSGGSAHTVISRRFEFVELTLNGERRPGGPAPYLDYRPATAPELEAASELLGSDWLAKPLDQHGRDYAIQWLVPQHVGEIDELVRDRVARTRDAVHRRLTSEIKRVTARAEKFDREALSGTNLQMNADRARQEARELSERLEVRLAQLDQEATVRPLPPRVVGGALVIPSGLSTASQGQAISAADHSRRLRDSIEVVLEAERLAGRQPVVAEEEVEPRRSHLIWSTDESGSYRLLNVKPRPVGDDSTVMISRNELLTALNMGDRYLFALVDDSVVDPASSVRYVAGPVAAADEVGFGDTGRRCDWNDLWSLGGERKV